MKSPSICYSAEIGLMKYGSHRQRLPNNDILIAAMKNWVISVGELFYENNMYYVVRF